MSAAARAPADYALLELPPTSLDPKLEAEPAEPPPADDPTIYAPQPLSFQSLPLPTPASSSLLYPPAHPAPPAQWSAPPPPPPSYQPPRLPHSTDTRRGKERVQRRCPHCGTMNHIRKNNCALCDAPKQPAKKRTKRTRRRLTSSRTYTDPRLYHSRLPSTNPPLMGSHSPHTYSHSSVTPPPLVHHPPPTQPQGFQQQPSHHPAPLLQTPYQTQTSFQHQSLMSQHGMQHMQQSPQAPHQPQHAMPLHSLPSHHSPSPLLQHLPHTTTPTLTTTPSVPQQYDPVPSGAAHHVQHYHHSDSAP
ncbi:hypothetical protein BWQ96_08438 [Gracilariopsis chorda]|uniref:Uncharacterized protein n=1 Tax=Gracilariopsis chorda TaxID=448386 RepID=A0A2V3IIF3_9FLOR|nr:hypothetical protein BWQ96_08438 [Gracilariopsis chorda]|eukprot:PXF41839.1 hypothetical protein BWQ96_08438 [Gracilariopsis chorda]